MSLHTRLPMLAALIAVPVFVGALDAHAQPGPYEDTAPIDDGTEPRRRRRSDRPVGSLEEAARRRQAVVIGEGGGVVPETYVVRRGDTLWDICGYYFRNPWRWPQVWSLNPQITNPHWIYPRDQVRLLPAGSVPASDRVARARTMVPDSVYLRDEAFIDDDELRQSGIISGAPEDQMLLGPFDELYIQFDEGQRVRVGQEYSVFREVREVLPPGETDQDAAVGRLVRIYGAARIESYDRNRGLARARITESLDPIERGFRVGPIGRRFEVVPPRRNERDVSSQIVAVLHNLQLAGNHQIVFLDRGRGDGVRIGNRFFVVRRGDEWRRTLVLSERGSGATAPDEGEVPQDELPLEVVAELRVVAIRETTATTVVTRAVHEVEIGDRAEMRRGY